MPKVKSKTPLVVAKSSTNGRRCRLCPDSPLKAQCMHTQKGLAFLATQKELSDKPSRGPQRCAKCLGRPLRAECIHTKVGQEFLRQKTIAEDIQKESIAAPAHVEESPLSLEVNPMRQYPPVYQRRGNIDTAPTTPSPVSGGFNFSTALGSIPIGISLQGPSPALASVSPSMLTSGMSGMDNPFGLPPSSPILPPTSPADRGSSPTVGQFSSPTISQDSSPTIDGEDALQIFSNIDPALLNSAPYLKALLNPGSAPDKRPRASKANPIHGFVEGNRGLRPHLFLRKNKRPTAVTDSKTASKTFLESYSRLVEKADDLAAKTGCWLFIGAQHSAGVGGTLSYSSPRLLRDAGEDADTITYDYDRLMSDLLAARRADALRLSRELEQLKAQNTEVTSQNMAITQSFTKMAEKVGDLQDKIVVFEALLEKASAEKRNRE